MAADFRFQLHTDHFRSDFPNVHFTSGKVSSSEHLSGLEEGRDKILASPSSAKLLQVVFYLFFTFDVLLHSKQCDQRKIAKCP